ncbi:hypothetical protein [Bradyrhizobium amphicarpaeae]|uniref:Cthe-2314-like HEPN domain-containing protein n=1 Tax=Bradyrhizobium amphicarpaeae TaxID=1404768 RepID=A0A2U8PZG0_9BRAD|nr:hypothetical protein [Bradyrhizobium amphicarpaeae]AWM03200.1 hypothetical protein CIT40_26265 [Bradyrhizobium amphicarpaeae]
MAKEQSAASYLKPDQIEKIKETLSEIEPKYNRLMFAVTHRRYGTERSWEYAQHGYGRRLGTIKRCIENVFTLIAPDESAVPDRNVLHDAQINIQAFYANVYGCIDNLAWVWVYERGLESSIPRARVGFRSNNKELRAALSHEFRLYLESIDPWLEYLIEYRDALAHRIPLYIPPGNVRLKDTDEYNALSRRMTEALYSREDVSEYEMLSFEVEKLLVFQPLIAHSVKETTGRPVFHVQMLTDFVTVEEIGYKVLDELA